MSPAKTNKSKGKKHLGSPVEHIGPRIRAIREEKGVRFSDLAESSDITEASLSRIETGHGSPSIEVLFSIARALNVSAARLVTDDNQPRFKVLGQINRKMPGLGSEQLPVISLPLAGSFDNACAFKTEVGGYVVGREIPEDFKPSDGQRVVFIRMNVGNDPSLHCATFMTSSGLGEERERFLLNADAWLGHLVSIHDTAQLLAALAEEKPAKEDLPTTKNTGWLMLSGSAPGSNSANSTFVPYASQTIAERWRVVAEVLNYEMRTISLEAPSFEVTGPEANFRINRLLPETEKRNALLGPLPEVLTKGSKKERQ